MKELFTLYYHRRILFTDFFSQSRKTPIYQKSHVNYSELLQLVKGWSNLVSNRIIIWRLPCKVKYAPFLGDKFLFVYPEGSISAKNICSCDRPVLRLKTIYLAVLYIFRTNQSLLNEGLQQHVLILQYVHLHGIRLVYCGVQMVIFRVICMEKSAFSTVSVWFWEILLSWCYHNISVFIYISVFILSENGFNC